MNLSLYRVTVYGAVLNTCVKKLRWLAFAGLTLLSRDNLLAQASGSGSWLYFNEYSYAYAPHDPALNAYPTTVMAWFKNFSQNFAYIVDKNYYAITLNSQGIHGAYIRNPSPF